MVEGARLESEYGSKAHRGFESLPLRQVPPLWRKRTRPLTFLKGVYGTNHRFRMGISNLKVGLTRKFASWSGERLALEKEIAKIAEAYETIEDKRVRVERLNTLIKCSREIMAELDPKWDHESVRPSVPNQRKLPYDPGMVARWAMQLIREATKPFSSRELAEKIVEMNNGDLDDEDLVNRVREAIDNNLRKKLGVYVRYTQVRPTLWERIDGDGDDVPQVMPPSG